jgi:hypothetical protein
MGGQVTVEAFHVHEAKVTILSGATESNALHLGAFAQCGIILPAAFTGTSISFLVSANGTDFSPFYDNANALVSITVTQGRAYALPINIFPFTWIKIKSNATEGGNRVIELPAKY